MGEKAERTDSVSLTQPPGPTHPRASQGGYMANASGDGGRARDSPTPGGANVLFSSEGGDVGDEDMPNDDDDDDDGYDDDDDDDGHGYDCDDYDDDDEDECWGAAAEGDVSAEEELKRAARRRAAGGVSGEGERARAPSGGPRAGPAYTLGGGGGSLGDADREAARQRYLQRAQEELDAKAAAKV